MLGFLLTIFGFSAFGALMTAIVVTAPDRAARRQARLRAIKEVKVSRNHQDLFLLTVDLVTMHERGYMSIFPDEASLERAKGYITAYREIAP